MQTVLRHVSVLVIALALALLGPGTLAHGMGGPDTTMMVICGSEGAETIWVDAAGNPVEPDQTCADCPDCTERLDAVALHGALATASYTSLAPALVRLPTGLPSAIQFHLRPATRAPPTLAPVWQVTERRSKVLLMDCLRHV